MQDTSKGKTLFTLKWLVIFSSLTAFTIVTIMSHFLGGTVQAYASRIAAEPTTVSSANWVLLGEKALSKSANHPNRAFWLNLDRFYEKNKLCPVDNSSLSRLTEAYGAEVHAVSIKGRTINIVTVPFNQQSRQSIKKDLRLSSRDINQQCKVVAQNYLFYLLFSGQVS